MPEEDQDSSPSAPSVFAQPSVLQSNTQGFWNDQFLNEPMPAARDEQAYQKELNDYYGDIEKREGIDERPDDWAVKGTKRGSLDKMQKDAPSYYPVPGDTSKDEKPGILEDRPWMKPAPSFDSADSGDWEQFPVALRNDALGRMGGPSNGDGQAGVQGGSDEEGEFHNAPTPPASTQPFWTDQLLFGEMQPKWQPPTPKDPPYTNNWLPHPPRTSDWGMATTPPNQIKPEDQDQEQKLRNFSQPDIETLLNKREQYPTSAGIDWDYFPLV
jgi:hypothetical protein